MDIYRMLLVCVILLEEGRTCIFSSSISRYLFSSFFLADILTNDCRNFLDVPPACTFGARKLRYSSFNTNERVAGTCLYVPLCYNSLSSFFFSSSFNEEQCYSLFVRVIVFQKGKKAGRMVFIGWRTRWTRWPASFFFFPDIKSRKKPRDETTSPFLTPILYLCWLRCRILSPVLFSSSSFTFTWFFLVVCYCNCCAKLFFSFSFSVFLLSSNRRKLLVNRCHF